MLCRSDSTSAMKELFNGTSRLTGCIATRPVPTFAATAVTTSRPSDGLCRTTSGAERNCGSAEPGWRGRNGSGFLLQRGH